MRLRSTLMKIGCAAVVVWAGSQAVDNVQRYNAIGEKVATLTPELNKVGQGEYRRKLIDALSANDVGPDDVRVYTDEEDYVYVVSVESRWTVGIGPWRIAGPVKHRASVKRVDAVNHVFVTG